MNFKDLPESKNYEDNSSNAYHRIRKLLDSYFYDSGIVSDYGTVNQPYKPDQWKHVAGESFPHLVQSKEAYSPEEKEMMHKGVPVDQIILNRVNRHYLEMIGK